MPALGGEPVKVIDAVRRQSPRELNTLRGLLNPRPQLLYPRGILSGHERSAAIKYRLLKLVTRR
jgi:hypothetical protein